MQKVTINLSKNTTAASKQRSIDMTGELLGIHLRNVGFSSDTVLDIFRSSSTHKTNRVLRINVPHGATQVMLRPRFAAVIGGSTAIKVMPSTSLAYAAIRMEFLDQPLLVRMSSQPIKSTTLTGTLTAYYG